MGCGCQKRGHVLKSAAGHIVRGDGGQVSARVGVVAVSAARDVRRALSAARRAFRKR